MEKKNKTRLARAAMTLLLALLTTVGAWAQETLTVNDGTDKNSYVPFYGLYADTQGAASECVIPSDVLGDMVGGEITAIKFYLSTPAGAAWTATFQVYLSEIDETTLTEISGPSSGTVVFTGYLDATGTELTITFDAPYTYNGGNLLIGSYVSEAGNWKSAYFTGTNQDNNTAWYRTSATASGSAAKFLPKTTFTYTPASTGGCDMPTSIAVNNITANGATVTWESEGEKWNLRYKVSTDADYTFVNGLTTKTYTFTNLEGNTIYSVGVQTVCTGSTSNFRSTSFTTENPCATPTNLVVSDITTSSATLSWTPGYQETSWTVKYKKSTETEFTEKTVSGTPTITLSGLEGLTTYNVRVFNCTEEGSPYLSGNITTGASFPYSQDFSGSGIPTGWKQYSGLLADVLNGNTTLSSGSGWSNGTSNGVLDGNNIYANIYGNSSRKWIVTPSIPVESNARLTFDVAYTAYSGTATNPASNGDDDKFVVLISTDNMATWTILRQWDNAGSEYVLNELTPAALHLIFDLSAYAGQNVNVAFYAESTVSNADNNIHVDNVVFELTPSCEKPTNILVTVNNLSATITWESEASSFDIAYSMDANAEPDNLSVESVNTKSYALNNLALGDHYVWVRANCSSTEHSAWAGPISVHIGYCVPAPSSVDNNGIANVTFGIGGNIVNNDTPKATYADYSNLIGALQAGVESTVNITYATGYTYGTIIWVDWDNSLSFEESEIVYMGTSEGNNPTTLSATFTIPATQATGDYRMRIGGADSAFDGYISGTSSTAPNPCYIGSYAVFQDYTLRVLEAPTCYTPTGLTFSNVSGHSVKLSWTSDANAWDVEVNGEVYKTGITANPYTLTGLTAETEYTVKVRANCGGGDVSLWSEAITFTTDIANPAPTEVAADNITSTSANISWTGNTDATSYNLRYRAAKGFNYGFETAEPWVVDDFPPCTTYDGDGKATYTFTNTPFTNQNYIGACIAFQNGVNTTMSAHSGNAFGTMFNSAEGPSNDWFILPEITIHDGDVFSFWAREITDQYGPELIKVGIYGNTQGTFASYLAGSDTESVEVSNTDWQQLSYDLSAYKDQTIRLAINCVSDDVFGFMFDDIFVGNPNDNTWDQTLTGVTSPYALTGLNPSTIYDVEVQAVYADGTSEWIGTSFTTNVAFPAPKNLVMDDITATTATISWDACEDATSYIYQYKKVSEDSWSSGTTVTTTSASLSDLEDATAYDFRVKAIYAGGESIWATIDFITDCLPKNLPYSYGFEDAYELSCWSLMSANSDNSIGILPNGDEDYAHEGTHCFLFSSYNSASDYDQWLISPTLNAESPVTVEFYYRSMNGYGDETFKVGYSTTTSEVSEFTWGEEISTTTTEWTTYTESFPAGTKYVAVWYYSQYQYYLLVDDFSFTVPETATITFAKEGYATYYNGEKDVVLPAGMKAHAVAAGGTSLTYAPVADGDTEDYIVPAETAVLLQVKPSDGDGDMVKPIYLVTPSGAEYTETNLLFGSDTQVTTFGGAKYYKLTYGSSTDNAGVFGWYWGADEGAAFTSPAHKAWLALPASAPSFLGLPDWEDTTGIIGIDNGQLTTEEGEWYTLQGLKIGKKPTTAGVYIHNGKKIIIK